MNARALATRALTALALAAFALAAIYGHLDLWRLFLRQGGEVAVNWRVVAPFAGLFGALGGLAVLHADGVWRAARSARAGALGGAAAAVALALVAIVVVNLVSARHPMRFDLTRTGAHTLAPDTVDALARLEVPIELACYLGPEDPWYPTVRALVEAFEAGTSGRIRARWMHPWHDAARLAALLEELRMPSGDLPEPRVLVLWTRGADDEPPRARLLGLSELVRVDRRAPDGAAPVRFRGEEALLFAIAALERTVPPLVAVVEGERARALEGVEPPAWPERLVSALRARGLRVEALPSPGDAARPRIPAACDVLIVPGARARLGAAELDAITRWVEAGGRLLLLLEPLEAIDGDDAAPSPERLARDAALARLLAELGLALAGPRLPGGFDRPVVGPAAPDLDPHPAVEESWRRGDPVRFYGAETVTPLGGSSGAGDGRARAGGASAARVEPLVALPAPEGAVGAPNFWVAAAARRRFPGAAREARAVVIADLDVTADAFLAPSARAANRDVLVRSVEWLGELRPPSRLAPRAPEVLALALDADATRRLWLLCLLELPGACVLIGILVWAVRRRG